MSKAKPTLVEDAAPLPEIPRPASDAIIAAAAQAQAAQAAVQQMVGLVLVTLGCDAATHQIAVEDGKAVVRRL